MTTLSIEQYFKTVRNKDDDFGDETKTYRK